MGVARAGYSVGCSTQAPLQLFSKRNGGRTPTVIVMSSSSMPHRPALPETPLEALGPSACEQVFIADKTFLIERPTESDRLLDHPAVRSAFPADEYLPFWADLWPASRMLAKAIVQEKWTPGTEALEIGCGLGLPGIAA